MMVILNENENHQFHQMMMKEVEDILAIGIGDGTRGVSGIGFDAVEDRWVTRTATSIRRKRFIVC